MDLSESTRSAGAADERHCLDRPGRHYGTASTGRGPYPIVYPDETQANLVNATKYRPELPILGLRLLSAPSGGQGVNSGRTEDRKFRMPKHAQSVSLISCSIPRRSRQKAQANDPSRIHDGDTYNRRPTPRFCPT